MREQIAKVIWAFTTSFSVVARIAVITRTLIFRTDCSGDLGGLKISLDYFNSSQQTKEIERTITEKFKKFR